MATANEERVTRTFLDLVRIDSPTFQEQAICRRLAAYLAALGLPVENDGTGPDVTHYCRLKRGASACDVEHDLVPQQPGDPQFNDETSGPRVAGTTQYAQWWSHPFWMVTSAVTATLPGSGFASRNV